MVIPKQIISAQLKFSLHKNKLIDLEPVVGMQFYKLFRARTAILYFINCAKQKYPDRSRVLISPFTIPDIINLIELSSVECDFYEIESTDLSYMGSYSYNDYLFVLVTHYNKYSISEENVAVIRRQTLLFEDGALAFGMRAETGSKIGSSTDGVFYSFSSFKTLSFFTGGIVFLNSDLNCSIKSKDGLDWVWMGSQVFKTLKFRILTQHHIFNWITFSILKRRIVNSSGNKLFERSETGLSRFNTMPQSMPKLIEYFLERRFDFAVKRRNHNNKIAAVYYEELKNNFRLKKPNPEIDNYTFYHLYLPNGVNRQELHINLIKSGFDIGLNLYPLLDQNKEMEMRFIYLPCNERITEKYAKELSIKLIEFLC